MHCGLPGQEQSCALANNESWGGLLPVRGKVGKGYYGRQENLEIDLQHNEKSSLHL